MSEVALFITSTAQPGRRDDVVALYREMMAPHAEANDAQRVIVWCADRHDPDRFHLFEMYTDEQSLGANAGQEFFADYLRAVGPLLVGEPTVEMAVPQWSKGV